MSDVNTATDENLKWQQKDSLRQMTSKFNAAIQNLEDLKESSTQVNQATEERISEVEQETLKQFQSVNESLNKKIESVTAEDIGLGKVNNTSDMEKPVSAAQQEAINSAKTEMLNEAATHLTSEEAGSEIEDSDNPEINPLIKNYIDKKIQEIGALSVTDNYGIAGTNNLGVVKATDDVAVDEETGKMSVPYLNTIKNQISDLNSEQENSKKRVDSIIQAASKIGDDTLNTQSKTIIAAINELYELIKKK